MWEKVKAASSDGLYWLISPEGWIYVEGWCMCDVCTCVCSNVLPGKSLLDVFLALGLVFWDSFSFFHRTGKASFLLCWLPSQLLGPTWLCTPPLVLWSPACAAMLCFKWVPEFKLASSCAASTLTHQCISPGTVLKYFSNLFNTRVWKLLGVRVSAATTTKLDRHHELRSFPFSLESQLLNIYQNTRIGKQPGLPATRGLSPLLTFISYFWLMSQFY